MKIFPEYESFRHGLVVSKIWLCEELERSLMELSYSNPTLHILGCWDNLISFMLLVRKPLFYSEVFGYDNNLTHVDASNALCNAWNFETPRVVNILADVNEFNRYKQSTEAVFINSSVDQIETLKWYDNIPYGSLICFQTTDIDIPEHPWYIKTVTKTLEDLESKFPVTKKLYSGIKNINYGNWGYNRLMLIGLK